MCFKIQLYKNGTKKSFVTCDHQSIICKIQINNIGSKVKTEAKIQLFKKCGKFAASSNPEQCVTSKLFKLKYNQLVSNKKKQKCNLYYILRIYNLPFVAYYCILYFKIQ